MVSGNTKLMMLFRCALHDTNGATPPALSCGCSCVSLPPTMTSKCGCMPGSAVTTSMVNGANVSCTHATSLSQCSLPCGYGLSITGPSAMLERFVSELSLPGVTLQPFGMQSLM